MVAWTWRPRNEAERVSAEKAVRFIENLKFSKGEWAGRPFEMLEWEFFVIQSLFGTLNPDGTRQYRQAYIEVPRKNGKSNLAAAISLKLLFADDEAMGEIYLAAEDRDQASIVFNVAASMVRGSGPLTKHSRVIDSFKRIIVTEGKCAGGVLRAIASDAAGTYGFDGSGIVVDEVHTQRNRELWDTLATSTAARRQPLMVGITTAGYDPLSLCGELHDQAMGLLKLRYPKEFGWSDLPVAVEDDPTVFAYVAGARPTDDWTKEATWKRANPSYGVTIQREYFEKEIRKAQQSPAYENTFKRLHLNIWTAQSVRWMPMDAWDRCRGKGGEKELHGRVAFGGLDLASTTDLAAFLLCLPSDDSSEPSYDLVARFWLPKDNLEERMRRDRVPYDLWAAQGFIQLTPGNVIDYSAVRRSIEADRLRFDLREVAFDRWGAAQMSQELTDAGMVLFPFGQGFASMGPPTKELLRLVLAGRIRHRGNPVLRWMADNTAVEEDSARNIKPTKRKSTQRIDGVVAAIMALDRAQRSGPIHSIYEQHGIEFV